MQKNYYQIFGVPTNATATEIRALHLEKRQQFAANPEIVRLLDQAAQVLTDPERRHAYDQGLLTAMRQQSDPVAAPETGKKGLRAVHLLFGGLLAAGAYGWHSAGEGKAPQRETPRPMSLAPVAPTSPATPIVADARNAAESGEEQTISLTPLPPLPATAPSAEVERSQPIRPAKKPGFDPGYVAWTVYQIVGAQGRGSGVMIDRDKIVTNCHVIAGSFRPESIVAINSVTHDALYPEKIAILSDSEDVCLLHVPGAPEYVASWGSANSLPIGAKTYTVSFPGREGLSWSTGNLLARDNVGGLDVLLSSNYCRPGVSGGPLFDSEGRIIGITSAGRRYRTRGGEVINGECVSIEAETAKQVLWRTLMPLAIAPLRYEGVWNGAR